LQSIASLVFQLFNFLDQKFHQRRKPGNQSWFVSNGSLRGHSEPFIPISNYRSKN